MSSAVDRRLSRLENLLGDIIERQRLGRFDNVMFLTYPIVILGFTTLTNAWLQSQTLENIMIPNVTLGYVLLVLSGIFALGMVLGFVAFVHAYIGDDLAGRVFAARTLIFGSLGGIVQAPVIILSPFLQKLVPPYSSSPFVATILSGGFVMALIYSVFCFSEGVVSWFTELITSWFKSNLPNRTLAEEKLHGISILRVFERPREKAVNFRLSKLAWVAACWIYGAMIVLSIVVSGLGSITNFHATMLAMLMLVIIIVVLRRKVTTIVSSARRLARIK